MVHRMTIRSNPRLLFLPLAVVVLLGLSVAAFAVGPLLGIGGLVLSAYIGYILFRFVTKQLRCTVEVLDDGLDLDMYGEEKVHIAWADVTHMGVATDARRRRLLFLYREDVDKLLAVPDEFERFDALLAAASAHGSLMELILGPTETVKDRLREIVGGSIPPPS